MFEEKENERNGEGDVDGARCEDSVDHALTHPEPIPVDDVGCRD